jgi:hypothetical protein
MVPKLAVFVHCWPLLDLKWAEETHCLGLIRTLLEAPSTMGNVTQGQLNRCRTKVGFVMVFWLLCWWQSYAFLSWWPATNLAERSWDVAIKNNDRISDSGSIRGFIWIWFRSETEFGELMHDVLCHHSEAFARFVTSTLEDVCGSSTALKRALTVRGLFACLCRL